MFKIFNEADREPLVQAVAISGRKRQMLFNSHYGIHYLHGHVDTEDIRSVITRPLGKNVCRRIEINKWRRIKIALHASCYDPRINVKDLSYELSAMSEKTGLKAYNVVRCVEATDFLENNIRGSIEELEIRNLIANRQAKIERSRANIMLMAFCAAALNSPQSKVSNETDKQFFENYKFTLSPREAYFFAENFENAASVQQSKDIRHHDKAKEIDAAALDFSRERSMTVEDMTIGDLAKEVEDVPFSTIVAFSEPFLSQRTQALCFG